MTGSEDTALRLDAVRAGIEAVREHLLHPTDWNGAVRMTESLAAIAEDLGHIRNAGPPVVEGFSDLVEPWRQVERLFEQARALHAGWFEIASADAGASYDSAGYAERSQGGTASGGHLA